MLPDLDEPGSTVARAAERVSGAIAYLIARLAGGHREATHSVAAADLATAVVAVLGTIAIAPHVPASIVPLGICVALCVRAVPPRALRIGRTAAFLAGAVAAWAIAHYVGIGYWIPAAVGIGWITHLAPATRSPPAVSLCCGRSGGASPGRSSRAPARRVRRCSQRRSSSLSSSSRSRRRCGGEDRGALSAASRRLADARRGGALRAALRSAGGRGTHETMRRRRPAEPVPEPGPGRAVFR